MYDSVFFILQDEDPALRELAETERENCVKDIQDLRKKVCIVWHFLLTLFSNEVQLKWKHSVTFPCVTYHIVAF